MLNSHISSTKKTVNNKVSNNSIKTTSDTTKFELDFQFETSEIGIIIVVNNTKYTDKPSIPKQK